MNKTYLVALVILGLVVGTVAVLSGGSGTNEGPTGDPMGDVVLDQGTGELADTGPADIIRAEVRRGSSTDLTFVVQMATDIPTKIGSGSLGWRWDLTENGEPTWLVTANVGPNRAAAVTSLKSPYGASTIDGTLQGGIEIAGDTLTVTIDASAIEHFPDAFTWELSCILDGDRADVDSVTATDSAPDGGPGEMK